MSFELASIYKESPGFQRTNAWRESYSCHEGGKPKKEEILSPTCSPEEDFSLSLIRIHHQSPWLKKYLRNVIKEWLAMGEIHSRGPKARGSTVGLLAGAFGLRERVTLRALGRLWPLRVQSTAALV